MFTFSINFITTGDQCRYQLGQNDDSRIHTMAEFKWERVMNKLGDAEF